MSEEKTLSRPQRLTAWIAGPPEAAERVCEIVLAACAQAGLAGAAVPAADRSGCMLGLGDGAVRASGGFDVLVALDDGAQARAGEAASVVICDARAEGAPGLKPGAAAVRLPGLDHAAACGALARLAGLDCEGLAAAFSRRLASESTEDVAGQVQRAQAAFQETGARLGDNPLLLRQDGGGPRPREGPLALESGVEALGRGIVAAGCTFYAGPAAGAGRGLARWLGAAAVRAGLVSHPAADEAAALGLAAGAAAAGVRALADLSAGSLAAAHDVLRMCAESGLPVVVLAPDDGWRWPDDLPVAELRPATVREANFLAAEAFNLAERNQVPVVVRADSGLLASWESFPEPSGDFPIDRGLWAAGPEASPLARVVPGREGAVRLMSPLPAEVLRRKKTALAGGLGPAPQDGPGVSALFPRPTPLPFEERAPVPAQAFLPAEVPPGRCAAAGVLPLLARAWAAQGLRPAGILVVSGSGCCREEPLFPATYGLRAPAGSALACAAGAKLANPALRVVVLDDGAALFSRGLAQLILSARSNCDLLVLAFARGAPSGDLLGLARQAGASFLGRVLPAGAEEAAAVVARAVAHKGFAVLECLCAQEGQAAPGPGGVIHEDAGRPTCEETEPALAAHGPPVLRDLGARRPRRAETAAAQP